MARLAMHGTYFSINPKPHGTYLANLQPPLKPSADTDSAIAAAAHATLSALYPTQKAFSDARRLRYFGSLVGITGRTRTMPASGFYAPFYGARSRCFA
jgi:hypothetical protein